MSNMQHVPGTVAELTLESGAVVRGMRTSEDGWRVVGRGDFYYDREVTNIRPLVVLDPKILGDVAFIVRRLRAAGFVMIAGTIEQQTKPPKPEETTSPFL